MHFKAHPLVPPKDAPFSFGDRTVLKEGRFLRMCVDSVRTSEGKEFPYEVAVRNGEPRIVTALPVTKNGEALLVWQYRIPMRRYVLENVAGLVDSGMSPAATAVKEILEETGYAVLEENVVDLGITTPASSGATTEKIECFAAFGAEFA